VSGDKSADLYEVWENGQWVNRSRQTYTYDAYGRMLTHLSELYFADWMIASRARYTYDDTGNLQSEENEDWENGQLTPKLRRTYTYDPWKHLTAIWSYAWTGTTWAPFDWINGFGLTDSSGNTFVIGTTYNVELVWRIVLTGVPSASAGPPESPALSQNYPNPFNPSTTIRYGLPERAQVSLLVFNTLGQQVAVLQNGEQEAGYHDVKFDASSLPSGVYFYRLQAGSYVETRKLCLVR
jgi:hypothetical protein